MLKVRHTQNAATLRQVRDDDVLCLTIGAILANEPRKVAKVVILLVVLGHELTDKGPHAVAMASDLVQPRPDLVSFFERSHYFGSISGTLDFWKLPFSCLKQPQAALFRLLAGASMRLGSDDEFHNTRRGGCVQVLRGWAGDSLLKLAFCKRCPVVLT